MWNFGTDYFPRCSLKNLLGEFPDRHFLSIRSLRNVLSFNSEVFPSGWTISLVEFYSFTESWMPCSARRDCQLKSGQFIDSRNLVNTNFSPKLNLLSGNFLFKQVSASFSNCYACFLPKYTKQVNSSKKLACLRSRIQPQKLRSLKWDSTQHKMASSLHNFNNDSTIMRRDKLNWKNFRELVPSTASLNDWGWQVRSLPEFQSCSGSLTSVI